MKIFISMKAPRDNDALRAASSALGKLIRAAGHEPFVAWREIEQQQLSPQQFMPFVNEHLRTCDLLIALYHPELRGGLVEIGMAYACNIPIWLAHLSGEKVSSSALGCADRVLEYSSINDLKDMIREHLSSTFAL